MNKKTILSLFLSITVVRSANIQEPIKLGCCDCISVEDRNLFNHRVINDIRKTAPSNKRSLILISFCAGYLLHDASIIRALLKKGYTDITVKIIDDIYKDKHLAAQLVSLLKKSLDTPPAAIHH